MDNFEYKNIYLIGNGGCAREVAYQIFCYNIDYNIVGYINNEITEDISVCNNIIKCVGDNSIIDNQVNILLTIGNINARKKFIEKYFNKTNFFELIIDSVNIADDFTKGNGNIICSNCFISTNVKFGDYNFINIGTTVCHDCVIGNNVVISPNVNIAGNVSIGDNTFVGIGATIIQGIKVGSNVTIGAGAVVINDVSDGATVVGVPAKQIDKK